MISKPSPLSLEAGESCSGLGGTLRSLAFIILLSVIAARCFLGEFGVRVSQVAPAIAAAQSNGQVQFYPDTREIARVGFAGILLAAVALWVLAGVIEGKLSIKFGSLGLLIIAFGVVSYFSARQASDQRTAINGWLEQVSLLGAGFLAIQLCGDRKRFSQLVVVIAAVGGALAAKGLYQYFVDAPERLADFDMYRSQRLGQLGFADGTPAAEMLRIRLADRSPTGFFSLINLYASLLIILLCGSAGLAASKIACALRDYPAWRKMRKKGEVHLPSLAAGLWVGVVAAIAVVLVLTSSKGAVAAVILAGLLAVAVGLFGKKLAVHWKKAVLAVACLAVLAGAGVVACGIKYDSLPTKTMTVRWYYWTGAAEIIREKPILGVGPGNFPAGYLQHRRAEAEEEVKNPHNFLLGALTQFGFAGGLLYIAAVGFVLVNLARPVPPGQQQTSDSAKRRPWALFIALALAPLAARLILAPAEPLVALFETYLPVVVFWIMLIVAGWCGGCINSTPSRALAIGLACGCVGFAIHNLLSFSLWAPATAGVFWVCSGACIGLGRKKRTICSRWLIWPSAVVSVLIIPAVILFVFAPALAKWNIHKEIYRSLVDRDTAGAIAGAIKLGQADPLDGLAASDASKLLLAVHPRRYERLGYPPLASPHYWSRQAVSRDPLNYTYKAMAGKVGFARQSWLKAEGLPAGARDDLSPLTYLSDAVQLNPQNIRLRLDYAEMLCNFGRFTECIAQLERAMEIDAVLPVGSVEHFKADEFAQIELLRERAKFQRNQQ